MNVLAPALIRPKNNAAPTQTTKQQIAVRGKTSSTETSIKPDSCACGGGCPKCLGNLGIQAKLKIGAPNDVYEQEADRVADQVMRMPDPMLQRQYKGCSDASAASPSDEEKPQIQRLANGTVGTGEVASDFRGHLGAGVPLDAASRRYFEPRFGHDFSNVRIHRGPPADRAAASIQARAFTLGRDVVFAAGERELGSAGGKRLLAHELTHVVQQNRRPAHGQIQRQQSANTTPARRATAYTFVGCTDGEIETLSRNIRQSYLMVINAREQMTNLILSIIQAESSRDYSLSTDAIVLRSLVGRLFGSATVEVLRDVRNNFFNIANRYRADREVTCHHDPERNQVASAEVGGTGIWIGSRYFSLYDDSLYSQPRIFIHEVAHNIGLGHDMVGIAFTVGETETETRPAQIAHHADSYAELAYRIYARDFFGNVDPELEI